MYILQQVSERGLTPVSLVIELQKEALDSSIRVSDLLRKALVVAIKLDLDEFQKWIKFELNGYGVKNKIPEYRHVKGSLRVHDPYYGLKPVYFSNPEHAKKYSTMLFNQPISELEGDIENPKDGVLIVEFNKRIEKILMESISPPLGLQPVLMISLSDILRIIDAIRNIILEWALNLEKDGILGNEMTFTSEEKATASVVTYNIQNMIQSQIQHDTTSSVQSTVVQNINFEELTKYLSELKSSIDKLNLTPDKKAELEAEIITIEAQRTSPNPKHTVINDSLNSIRAILQGAAGSAIGGALLEGMKILFGL